MSAEDWDPLDSDAQVVQTDRQSTSESPGHPVVALLLRVLSQLCRVPAGTCSPHRGWRRTKMQTPNGTTECFMQKKSANILQH